MMNKIDAHRKTLDYKEIDIKTATKWVETGVAWVSGIGEENLYLVDTFDKVYYCKCIGG